jgi:hypothetical protein
MKLVPRQWDEYNPVLVAVGAIFLFAGGYALSFMGVKGPLIGWLLRAIPAIFVAMGSAIRVRQFQLWRKLGAGKKRNPHVILGGR